MIKGASTAPFYHTKNYERNDNMPEPNENMEPNPQAGEVNYDDLLASDERFSSWLKSQTKKAAESAAQEANRRWKVMHDNSMSEAERLRSMTAEEQVEYYRKKFEDAEAAHQRRENARKLEGETASLFSQSGIPNDFLPLFDFETATAESVKGQVGVLSQFEFYPKGTFEQKVQEAVNQKLQQKPPSAPSPGGETGDLDARINKALESGDRVTYIKLMNEKAKKSKKE